MSFRYAPVCLVWMLAAEVVPSRMARARNPEKALLPEGQSPELESSSTAVACKHSACFAARQVLLLPSRYQLEAFIETDRFHQQHTSAGEQVPPNSICSC